MSECARARVSTLHQVREHAFVARGMPGQPERLHRPVRLNQAGIPRGWPAEGQHAHRVQPHADRGVLLDGFPRTLPQARTLDVALAERGGSVTAAIFLDVPTDVLVERLSGRRVCIGYQSTFHVVLQQLPLDGTCPDCGDQLVQRPDDAPRVVARRVTVYQQQTGPVLDYSRVRGVLRRADGSGSVEQTRSQALDRVGLREAREARSASAGRDPAHAVAS
jgi:adenylate kinase family enzyme